MSVATNPLSLRKALVRYF